MGDPQYGYPEHNPIYSDNRLNNPPPYQPNYIGQAQQPPPGFGNVQNTFHGGQYCPVCNMNTNSYVKKGPGNITWIWCIILFFFTGILCFVPFLFDSCK